MSMCEGGAFPVGSAFSSFSFYQEVGLGNLLLCSGPRDRVGRGGSAPNLVMMTIRHLSKVHQHTQPTPPTLPVKGDEGWTRVFVARRKGDQRDEEQASHAHHTPRNRRVGTVVLPSGSSS